MSIAASDPLAVIASEAPRLSEADAARLVLQHWGLEVCCEGLVSERDQNFRLQTGTGTRLVLKIANSVEDPLVTDFQVQALLHIERFQESRHTPLRTPQIRRTEDGETQVAFEHEGQQHAARIVSYLEGVPLENISTGSKLCRNLGIFLAHLGLALEHFEHPAASHPLLWDMQEALNLRELLRFVTDPDVREAVALSLDDFELHALPSFATLRSQVIHNDFNPGNVLIEAGDTNAVAGVIDFGDMMRSPLVVDVAIGAAYLRAPDGDPLQQVAEFLAGYHSVRRLLGVEIELLFDLIRARLCATISILHWRAAVRGDDDPYLQSSAMAESSAERFLQRLMEIPRQHAASVLRQVCASERERSRRADPQT